MRPGTPPRAGNSCRRSTLSQLVGPLHAAFADEALLELLMLAGFYTTVSYLTNALRLPLEPASTRFPSSIRERGSEVAGAGGHGHR
jgi:hypothetical protein